MDGWKAAWWWNQAVLRSHDVTVLSGLSGYVYKQAAICTNMAEKCALYWLPHPIKKGFTPEWASEYESQQGPADDSNADDESDEEREKVETNKGVIEDFDFDV
jgi:hypothetical protein